MYAMSFVIAQFISLGVGAEVGVEVGVEVGPAVGLDDGCSEDGEGIS